MADFDAVVIGSGAGGLTAALALAQAGRKVAVFEQHYVPGGWCHTFQLGGHRFSPGVHYLGEMGPGGRARAIYEGLGVSADLEFCELNPDGYDHVLLGRRRFDIPKGREAYAERLCEAFPAERRGIRELLATVQRLSDELDGLGRIETWGQALALPLRAPTLGRWGLRTAESLLGAYVRDPELKGILGAQAGDHGLPPSLAPAPVHAAVMAHYFGGGYYPRGGGFAIPRAFVRALRRAGGELHLRTPVARILMEGGRAAGVRLADGREVRARWVVSNADPEVTFGRLMAPAELPWGIRRKLGRTRWSVSAVSLFMAAELDAKAAGLDSGNYWYYRYADVEGAYRFGMTDWRPEAGDLPGLFLTVTTLKDPSKRKRGVHTMEAFTFVDDAAFSEWQASAHQDRPEAYQERKERLKDRMLDAAERIVPGLRERLVFADIGTPLTNRHYLYATRGNLYGTEKSRWQVGPFGWPVRSAVPGLLMCGASTLSHGVMGATVSGLYAAAELLGGRPEELLGRKGPSIRIYPSDRPEAWPAELRERIGAGTAPVHA